MPKRSNRKRNNRKNVSGDSQSNKNRNDNSKRIQELQEKEKILQKCMEHLAKGATSQARVHMYMAEGSIVTFAFGTAHAYRDSNPADIFNLYNFFFLSVASIIAATCYTVRGFVFSENKLDELLQELSNVIIEEDSKEDLSSLCESCKAFREKQDNLISIFDHIINEVLLAVVLYQLYYYSNNMFYLNYGEDDNFISLTIRLIISLIINLFGTPLLVLLARAHANWLVLRGGIHTANMTTVNNVSNEITTFKETIQRQLNAIVGCEWEVYNNRSQLRGYNSSFYSISLNQQEIKIPLENYISILQSTLKKYHMLSYVVDNKVIATSYKIISESQTMAAMSEFRNLVDEEVTSYEKSTKIKQLLQELMPNINVHQWRQIYTKDATKPVYLVNYYSSNEQIIKNISELLGGYLKDGISTFQYQLTVDPSKVNESQLQQLNINKDRIIKKIKGFYESDSKAKVKFTFATQKLIFKTTTKKTTTEASTRGWYNYPMTLFSGNNSSPTANKTQTLTWDIIVKQKSSDSEPSKQNKVLKFTDDNSNSTENTSIKFSHEKYGITYYSILITEKMPADKLNNISRAHNKGKVNRNRGNTGVTGIIEKAKDRYEVNTSDKGRAEASQVIPSRENRRCKLIVFDIYDENAHEPSRSVRPSYIRT